MGSVGRRLLLAVLLTAVLPATADPVEIFVEAPGPLGPLKGTMLSAAPKSPLVLIIPGSGPTDRNGNSPAGIQASTYKLLAEGLARQGISSVRIDKRGMFGSAAAVADANAVTIADYAADVHAWIAMLRKERGAACVWVLGHSEGALVAQVAAKDGSDICGLVLASAAGRPLGQILREQLRSNPANAPILDQALKDIDSLEAGQHVDVRGSPVLRPLFAPQVQNFEINEFIYDPARLIADYTGPVLILQGQRDLQVRVLDAEMLGKSDPRAKLVLLADVNHVLKTVASDSREANIATYADPSLPLAGGVSETIAQFITTHPVAR